MLKEDIRHSIYYEATTKPATTNQERRRAYQRSYTAGGRYSLYIIVIIRPQIILANNSLFLNTF